MALFREFIEGILNSAMVLMDLVWGPASGHLVSAQILVVGFLVLLVLAATRYRALALPADRWYALAFFVACIWYSALLGMRISVDLYELSMPTAVAPIMGFLSHPVRGLYLLVLAAAAVAEVGTSRLGSRRLVFQAGLAWVGTFAVVGLVARMSLPSHGLVGIGDERVLDLVVHLVFGALAVSMLVMLGRSRPPGLEAVAGAWLVLLVSQLIALIGSVLAESSTRLAALADVAFVLHVPLLLVAMGLRDRSYFFKANHELKTRFSGVLTALLCVEGASDPDLRAHSQRHAELARRVARRLGYSRDDAEEVHWAALLHDIGKLNLDRAVLAAPRSLAPAEWVQVRRHPTLGAEVLESIAGLERVATYIRHHHERWDGTGYPDGLGGEAIPLGARIVAVVDAFDAMLSTRPYRRPRTLLDAVSEIRACSGKDFDPEVVAEFLGILAEQGVPVTETA